MIPIHSALIVNDCATNDMLTLREFVWPIQRNLPIPSKVVHISKLKPRDVDAADVIIFSGCQLKDNNYIKLIPKLKWLAKMDKPLLGVCAGHHIIGSIFGGKVSMAKKPAIGVHSVTKTHDHALTTNLDSPFSVYSLHGNVVSLPKNFISLAKSKEFANELIVHAHKPIVGVSFHPEVLNKSFFADFIAWAERK